MTKSGCPCEFCVTTYPLAIYIDDPVRAGDDWYVTFQCGINRELVGWLFQWMSNVKVIGPPKLKELYDEQLVRMQDVTNQQPEESLAYTNTFSPNH